MKNILEAIYETRSKTWDRLIEGNQKSTPEDRMTTGRSDHREKKKKNIEFDRKSRRANKIDLTPFTFPPDQFTWWLNIENRKYKQRRELLRITEIEFDKKTTISHPVVFVFDIEGRNGGERSRGKRISDPRHETHPVSVPRPAATIGSMANADIEGDMFWNTPLSSVLMSRFLWAYLGDVFLPTCLPRRDIRVVLPRCTVCRANRAHRKKFWPVETRNFDEFFFFFSHFRSRYVPFFDSVPRLRSTPPPVYFLRQYFLTICENNNS